MKKVILQILSALIILILYFQFASNFTPEYSPDSKWEIIIFPYIKFWGELAFGSTTVALLCFLLYWAVIFFILLLFGHLFQRMKRKKNK